LFVLLIALLTVPAQLWYFTIEPARRERIHVADTEIYELDKRIEMARAAERKLPQFRNEVSRLEVEHAKLMWLLPPQSAEPNTPAVFSSAAHENPTVVVRSVMTDRAKIEAAWIERVWQVDAGAATFSALAGFFGTFATTSRALGIERVDFQRDGNRWRASAVIVVPYERGDAISSAATSSARTGLAK
jgi:hypothetical protein